MRWPLLLTAALAGCVAPSVARPVAASLTIVAAGDLELSGAVDPLAELDGVLGSGLGFCNLEGPFSDGEATPSATMLGAPAAHAVWLRGRFAVVSLANNHALDRGDAGLRFTRGRLASVGVLGVEHTAIEARPGLWWVARDLPPTTPLDHDAEVDRLVDEVRRLVGRGRVIVSLHWGHTGSLLPRPEQRRLAIRLVDAGASAVLGHGPHTPQGVERHGHAIIAYSLGNLAFGCDCTDASDGYVLRFSLHSDGQVNEVSLVPIEAGLRRPARRSSDPQLLELLGRLTRDLGSVTHTRKGIIYVD